MPTVTLLGNWADHW